MLHLDATDSGPLVGVAVGAVLATMGGLLGGQIENRLNRKEREHAAALLFGEILAALRLILRLADESRGRGERYGPITMRILKAAVRETQIYDRNRETLFAVPDPLLRAKTHVLLIQMSLTLEAVQEAAEAIKVNPDAESAVAEREGSFNFAMELHAELPPLIARFEKLARQRFDAPELVLQAGRAANPLASA
ncbi:MAG: hypothetical protein ACHP9T_02115 [Caulobacterales bacterium]|jgi:hypothetical protein